MLAKLDQHFIPIQTRNIVQYAHRKKSTALSFIIVLTEYHGRQPSVLEIHSAFSKSQKDELQLLGSD